MFNLFTTVFAEGEQASAAGGSMGGIMSIAWIVILFVLMYFMLIRPQRKQQKEQQKMLNALEVGDKVVTIGGICGKVTKIKDDNVWIVTGRSTEEAEKCCIQFERGSIKSVDKKIEE